MDFLPLMLKISNMNCLIVGGGRVALKKALILLRFGAKVTIVSPRIHHRLQKMQHYKLIDWKSRKFSWFDLFSCRLVVAATDNHDLNRKVCRWAEKLGVLHNSVDNPDVSAFIFPAIHVVNPLTIAVSTQGKAPVLARKIKQEIAARFRRDYSSLIEKTSILRQQLKTIVPDIRKRRLFLNRFINVKQQEIPVLNENQLQEELEKWISVLPE